MQNKTLCILGGTGFVGSHLACRLAANGHQVRILTRRRENHRDLLVVPGVEIHQANIFDRQQLKKHFNGADAVINLVGILNEKQHNGTGFRKAHVELPKLALDVCLELKIPRLLHMSALNADAASSPSHYLRTKGEGENSLHTFAKGKKLAVTSFRPSVIFGPNDSFFNRFAGLLKITPVAFPLACPNARFAPVYVGDVVERFIRAIDDKNSFGKHYDICGPKEYTLAELVRYTSNLLGLKRTIIGLPNFVSKIQAGILEFAPGKPFSIDNYHSLQVDSVCKRKSGEPTSIETIVPQYICKGTSNNRHDDHRANARRY